MTVFRWVFALLIALSVAPAFALELKLGLLPGVVTRGETVSVIRANGRILFGGAFFWMGPFGEVQALTPQITDTSYGLAMRLGTDVYVELQGGPFLREFYQNGTKDMRGTGYAANLILGFHASENFGVDVGLMGKRISDGDLDKRTIVDLLPMLTIREVF